MKRRINYIDFLRGIAIILVVIGHVCQSLLKTWIYSFHIPLFFFISGVLLSENKKWQQLDFKTFLKNKALSFIYPYFTFSILSIIYRCIFENKSILIMLFQVFTFDGIITLWYLPCLFIGEVLFFLFYKNIRKLNIKLFVIVLFIVITTVFSLTNFQYNRNLKSLFYFLRIINIFNRSLIAFIFIYIGYNVNRIFNMNYIKRKYYPLIILIAFLLNFILFRYNDVDIHYSIIGNPLLFYINSISCIIAIYIMCKYYIKKNNLIEFLGKNSLIIFGTHLNLNIVGFANTITNNLLLEIISIFFIEIIIIFIVNKFFKFIISYE